jgi:YD repeat-containing protein
MSDLVNNNQVTTPIIVERYEGSTPDPYATLLEKVQTFYGNTNSVPAQVLPIEVRTYLLGEPNGQQRVLYEKYSNFGTLIQYRKSSEDFPVSLIWGHYKKLPIAKVTNAETTQVAFTSFDEPTTSEGGWTLVSGSLTGVAAKTGIKSLADGSTINRNDLPAGDYIIGFWARVITGSSGSVTVNGTPVPVTGTEWNYYQTSRNTTSVTVSNSNVFLDEVRLHPLNAQMISYTYEPLVGMTSQTDPNGNVTYFEYDSSGRLHVVKDMDGNIVKLYNYRFTNEE